MPEVTTLRDDTVRLLRNRPASITVKEVATEIGVSPAWVYAFMDGSIKNPGVVTVETLNVFLKKRSKACV